MGDIERAARKQRGRDAGATWQPAPDPAATRELEAAKLIRRSLAERSAWDFSPLLFVQFLLWFFTPMAVLFLVGSDSNVLFMLAGVVGLALFMAMQLVTERLLAAARERALHRIGHGFDAGSYLAALAQQRRSSKVVVRLGFAKPWPAEELTAVCDAVRAWTGFPSCSAEGDRSVVMSSGPLDTTDSTSARVGSRTLFFTNRPAHDAFQRVVRKVVPRLHRRNPVTQFAVELRGEVTPF